MSDTGNRWSSEATEGDRHDVGGGVFAKAPRKRSWMKPKRSSDERYPSRR